MPPVLIVDGHNSHPGAIGARAIGSVFSVRAGGVGRKELTIKMGLGRPAEVDTDSARIFGGGGESRTI